MASSMDVPVDLYIAAYGDPDAARGDWDAIKQLARYDVSRKCRLWRPVADHPLWVMRQPPLTRLGAWYESGVQRRRRS
jgi:hypothetical protein